MTNSQQINFVKNLKNDFPGIYLYYFENRYPNWQHEQMADFLDSQNYCGDERV